VYRLLRGRSRLSAGLDLTDELTGARIDEVHPLASGALHGLEIVSGRRSTLAKPCPISAEVGQRKVNGDMQAPLLKAR
jgi:hypothetical protein